MLRHLRVLRDNTRAGPGLRVRDNTRVGYLVGAPRGRRVGSTNRVPRFGLHFHAWRVEMARRVDAAWKWGQSDRDLSYYFHAWRVEMARRVDAAWKWDQSA